MINPMDWEYWREYHRGLLAEAGRDRLIPIAERAPGRALWFWRRGPGRCAPAVRRPRASGRGLVRRSLAQLVRSAAPLRAVVRAFWLL